MKKAPENTENISSFYCQNVCCDEKFSIDEWNKAYHEVKDKSEEIQKMVLDGPGQCVKQCFECMATVGKRRLKTQEIMQGFIVRDGQKTTVGIENLCAESEHASRAALNNQYF